MPHTSVRPVRRRRVARAGLLAALAGLAGCGDDPTGPTHFLGLYVAGSTDARRLPALVCVMNDPFGRDSVWVGGGILRFSGRDSVEYYPTFRRVSHAQAVPDTVVSSTEFAGRYSVLHGTIRLFVAGAPKHTIWSGQVRDGVVMLRPFPDHGLSACSEVHNPLLQFHRVSE